MSAGAFIDSVYETNGGDGYAIRIQPETITTWNPISAAVAVAGQPSAQVSKGRRTIGINARLARFRWTGAVPTGYQTDGIVTVPVLTQAAWEALVKATDYQYLGNTVRLVGKTPEAIR